MFLLNSLNPEFLKIIPLVDEEDGFLRILFSKKFEQAQKENRKDMVERALKKLFFYEDTERNKNLEFLSIIFTIIFEPQLLTTKTAKPATQGGIPAQQTGTMAQVEPWENIFETFDTNTKDATQSSQDCTDKIEILLQSLNTLEKDDLTEEKKNILASFFDKEKFNRKKIFDMQAIESLFQEFGQTVLWGNKKNKLVNLLIEKTFDEYFPVDSTLTFAVFEKSFKSLIGIFEKNKIYFSTDQQTILDSIQETIIKKKMLYKISEIEPLFEKFKHADRFYKIQLLKSEIEAHKKIIEAFAKSATIIELINELATIEKETPKIPVSMLITFIISTLKDLPVKGKEKDLYSVIKNNLIPIQTGDEKLLYEASLGTKDQGKKKLNNLNGLHILIYQALNNFDSRNLGILCALDLINLIKKTLQDQTTNNLPNLIRKAEEEFTIYDIRKGILSLTSIMWISVPEAFLPDSLQHLFTSNDYSEDLISNIFEINKSGVDTKKKIDNAKKIINILVNVLTIVKSQNSKSGIDKLAGEAQGSNNETQKKITNLMGRIEQCMKDLSKGFLNGPLLYLENIANINTFDSINLYQKTLIQLEQKFTVLFSFCINNRLNQEDMQLFPGLKLGKEPDIKAPDVPTQFKKVVAEEVDRLKSQARSQERLDGIENMVKNIENGVKEINNIKFEKPSSLKIPNIFNIEVEDVFKQEVDSYCSPFKQNKEKIKEYLISLRIFSIKDLVFYDKNALTLKTPLNIQLENAQKSLKTLLIKIEKRLLNALLIPMRDEVQTFSIRGKFPKIEDLDVEKLSRPEIIECKKCFDTIQKTISPLSEILNKINIDSIEDNQCVLALEILDKLEQEEKKISNPKLTPIKNRLASTITEAKKTITALKKCSIPLSFDDLDCVTALTFFNQSPQKTHKPAHTKPAPQTAKTATATTPPSHSTLQPTAKSPSTFITQYYNEKKIHKKINDFTQVLITKQNDVGLNEIMNNILSDKYFDEVKLTTNLLKPILTELEKQSPKIIIETMDAWNQFTDTTPLITNLDPTLKTRLNQALDKIFQEKHDTKMSFIADFYDTNITAHNLIEFKESLTTNKTNTSKLKTFKDLFGNTYFDLAYCKEHFIKPLLEKINETGPMINSKIEWDTATQGSKLLDELDATQKQRLEQAIESYFTATP